MGNQKSLAVALALALLCCGAEASQARTEAGSDGSDRRESEAGPARGDLAPELAAFLGFIEDEEEELQFQLQNDEITPAEYRLSKARLGVTREAVLRIARGRKEGAVPELHVLLASELGQVLPEGLDALRGKKPGDRVSEVWRYHGSVSRGQTFYILERTETLGPARAF